jgi:hypothetical protein
MYDTIKRNKFNPKKHFVGPSMGISMPLKEVLQFALEKQKNGLLITYQRNNMNEGTGNCHIPEDSMARFQSR